LFVTITCVAIVGCKRTEPPPAALSPASIEAVSAGSIQAPPDPRRELFAQAVFAIYDRARPSKEAVLHTELVLLPVAAVNVEKGAHEFGDLWRALTITQLAAADIKRLEFQDAINVIARNPTVAHILQGRLADLHVERSERERFVYDLLLQDATLLKLESSGLPTCEGTYPTATTERKNGLVQAQITTFIKDPLPDLAAHLDPQAWANSCSALSFAKTYVTALKSDGTFDVDPQTFNAKQAPAKPIGQPWTGFLFEYYLLPGVVGGYFKNILSVETASTSNSYEVKTYNLSDPIHSSIPPDPERDGGLFTDEGYALATDAGNSNVFVQAAKTLRFMSFATHSDMELADMAETALRMAGSAYVYWLCCPKN